jgi:hypothetical protein
LEGLESETFPGSGALFVKADTAPMHSTIGRFRIQTLKAKIEASHLYCDALTIQFEAASTDREKAKIGSRLTASLKMTQAMQLLLEMLEKHEQEGLGDGDSVAL